MTSNVSNNTKLFSLYIELVINPNPTLLALTLGIEYHYFKQEITVDYWILLQITRDYWRS